MHVSLNVVILEKDDIRKCGIILGGTCCSNSCLNIGRSRLLDDVQLEVRILLLISCLCSFQSRDVEVLVPCVYGKCVLIFRSCDVLGRLLGRLLGTALAASASCKSSYCQYPVSELS
jgi:hypothetical protein